MNTGLPSFFESIFWGVNFSSISPKKHKRTVIVKTINFGRWEHWKWITRYYGKEDIRETISNIPESEFRPSALRLISILVDIKKMKYKTRSGYIKANK